MKRQTYILPLKGLGKGLYEYDLKVDDTFVSSFPDSPLERADLDVKLTVEKRSRQMVIDFAFNGTVATACDRCLADIDLPVNDQRQLIVKLSEETEEQQDEGDIVYLHPDTHEFDLAPFVYEMVALAVPMIRTYDCRSGEPPYPCDEEMLDRIEASYESADEVPGPTPFDVLKNLNKNKE